MSITFRVEGSNTRNVPCHECGASVSMPLDNDCKADNTLADAPCYGMGFYVTETPELNISNTNAFHILRSLNFEPDYCGSISPDTLLRELAVVNASENVRSPYDNHGIDLSINGVKKVCRVIDTGVSVGMMGRYVNKLREMANIAKAKRVDITYG